MFEQFVRQLKSGNPLDRRQAIVKITNSGHPDSLALLEKYIAVEKDAEVRALVQKAVDYLRTNRPKPDAPPPASGGRGATGTYAAADAAGGGARGKPGSTSNAPYSSALAPAVPPAEAIIMQPPTVVSEQKKRAAKGRLDAAMQQQINGNRDKAILELKRALELNPDLKKDQFAFGLAAQLTGGSADPFPLIMESSAPKNENLVAQGAETLLSFTLEVLIIMVIVTIFLTVSYRKFGEIAIELVKYAAESGLEGSDALRQLAATSYVDQRQVFIDSIGRAIISVGGLIMYSMFMYAVGVFIGGSGGVLNFLRAIMRVNAAIYLALGAVLLLIPTPRWIPRLGPDGAPDLMPFGLMAGILVIGYFLWVYFAGRAHGFGFGKGCAMVALTGIAISCLSTILVMLGGNPLSFEPTSILLLFR
jgi:hypothetical protein